jgi:hypothetical protein
MTVRRGKRHRQLLDDLKEARGYCKLKEEVLDLTLWGTRFGRGYGPVVRQTQKLMTWNELDYSRFDNRQIYQTFLVIFLAVKKC